jgi:type IV pilus assembly protein PilW
MTTLHPFDRRAPRAASQSGVTLIELMVGMTIGLIAVLIVTQVLSLAENQKRTTSTGSEAQVNGALALYTLQRDLQMSGYGLITRLDALGCEIRAQFGGANQSWTLAPVVITDGGAGAPDTIATLSAAKLSPALPTKVTENHPTTTTEFLVATSVGIGTGDVLIAVPDAIDATHWCSVLNATAVTSDAAGHHVAHVTGTTGPWNQDPASTIFPVGGYPAGSYLIDVGQLVRRVYSVDLATHTLQSQVQNTQAGLALSAADAVYPHIVNMKAMYGKDTNADGVVDTYDTVTPTTAVGWSQVLTVRVAVVARGAQYEKDPVTFAQPAWDFGSAPAVAGSIACPSNAASKCVALKINDLPDWDHYRYKVYDTVVPLRNMLWSS